MSDNQKFLSESRIHAEEFETELEPERLREAYLDLENVVLDREPNSGARGQLRMDTLSLWLHLLNLLDRWLDPKFDPNVILVTLVQPPLTSGGVMYGPGADPALIDDPLARAEYEKAISDNRAKADHYRLQVYLHRLNERIPPRVETFIRDSYTPALADQNELKTAIEGGIDNQRRKEALLKLLAVSQPQDQ